MIKKISAVVMVLCIGMFANASAVKADAEPEQTVYSNRCCDASATVRCFTGAMYPLGAGCWCYGLGTGYIC